MLIEQSPSIFSQFIEPHNSYFLLTLNESGAQSQPQTT